MVFNSKEIFIVNLEFSQSTIDGSGNISSALIDLAYLKPEGFFTLRLLTAGAGSAVKAEFLICNTRDGTYYEPVGSSDIVSSHSPGEAEYSFSPPVASFMKIKLTEVNGSAVSSFSSSLTIQ